jgi:hypothetical protein
VRTFLDMVKLSRYSLSEFEKSDVESICVS